MRPYIENLLRPEVLIVINDSLKEVVAKEKDPGARLKELTFKNIPANACAFELDHSPSGELKTKHPKSFKQLSCYIRNDHKQANKKCDVVIAFKKGNTAHFLIADMKSDKPKKSECKLQLRNSELFILYLASLMKEYHAFNSRISTTKIAFSTQPGIIGKPVTQQKNKLKIESEDGVFFAKIPVGGRNNSKGITSVSDFI
ncbi:hypothetical protein T8J41_03550 [Nitratireductor rhodophyticola]|uniref:hypothetical protein n=1 Tax=Nitratireductor rhodophyticola TaxID=2854036 RepID=UPI002AC95155|nr:hypothetical protein [Nitratireductor rhodophyticola]WPZ14909.1 hypothetical protein T8J41_03550 [Nitratireductor rhodophyticola]